MALRSWQACKPLSNSIVIGARVSESSYPRRIPPTRLNRPSNQTHRPRPHRFSRSACCDTLVEV